MKQVILFWIFLVSLNGQSQAKERPFIWVQSSEREAILEKIDEQEWANHIYQNFIEDVNKDLDSYQDNPQKFLKNMPFDREMQQPGKIPPFRLTHNIDNGKQNNLDNATDEEMAAARKLNRYLQTGVDCGIAYFLTENEDYAQCALDILYTFIEGVTQHEPSEWRRRGGWLFPYDVFREVRML